MAMALCRVLRMAWSPQPGHQRTDWSLLKLAGVYCACVSSVMAVSEGFEDFVCAFDDFADLEGLALNLVYAADAQVGELGLEIVGEHARVELGDDDALVSSEELAGVGRKRVDVAEVGEGDFRPCRSELFGCRAQMAVGASPADEDGVGVVGADGFEGGDVACDAGDFLAAEVHHLLMVRGVGGDCACHGVLLEAAEAVCEAFGAGDCPVAREGLFVAVIGAPAFGALRNVGSLDFGEFVGFGHTPGGGAVADEGVAQEDYRSHVLHGDAAGLEGHGEAVGGRRGSHDGHGRFAVAAVESLEKVGLFGLGGEAGGGAAALYVDYHEGEFGDYGEADSLALECETGAGGGGHGEVACEAGADCGADAGDFVLHLYGLNAEVLALGELVENVRGRGDGVGAEEERAAALLGGHDEAPGRGRVAVDVGVDAGAWSLRVDAVGADCGVYVVAVVEAGLKDQSVGLVDCGLLGEFVLEVTEGRFERTVEEPADKAEGEDVAAFKHALVVQPCLGQSGAGHGGDGHFDDLGLDAEFLEGLVGSEKSFPEVSFLEGVDVDDDYAAGLEEAEVLLEGRGIHGHEDVALVAGSVHTGAYAHLKARYAAERALRGADFRGIVGKCGDEIAQPCGYVCEDVSCELHSVAGVTREAYYDLFKFAYLCFFQHRFLVCGYVKMFDFYLFARKGPGRAP